MQKLKKILQFKYTFVIIIIISLIYSLLITLIPKYKSIYDKNETNFTCILEEYKIDGNKLNLNLKCKEKLIGTYYIKTLEEKEYYENNLNIGSILKINGNLNVSKNNTIPYLFNYKKYLYNQKIYYILSIEKLTEIKNDTNLFYTLKNKAYKRAKQLKNNTYIYAYILGKTYKIDNKVIESYRTNGISHLFALSGLHVGIFSMIIMSILSKFKVNKLLSYIIAFLFLLTFSFLTGFSPSILRASLLFFIIGLNKILKLEIKTINILLLVFSILVFINPFIIYNLSFIMSFTTTFFIILGSDFVNDKNYLKGLLKVSSLSFISNIALSIYYFNYISPLGILLNLIFVPLISFLIFPLTLITYIFPFMCTILNLLTNLMESFSLYLSKFMIKIYFPHINLIEVIIYYTILILLIKLKNKNYLLVLIIILVFWKIKPLLENDTRIFFIDIGQGDSALIITPHTRKVIMIDTGGKISWNDENWKQANKTSSIATNELIPFMRNLGISKLDYLILTHGDQDHAGEAQKLIDNFKVENVYINKGNLNKLENNITKKQTINFKKIKIDNLEISSLNNKIFNNENDDSIVLYIKIEDYKFLFMGDGSVKTEENIMNYYSLPEVDILKVGHHGSNTSSSEKFIDKIKPKISVISSGLNNRYNHPHEEIVKRLIKYGKTYNTANKGTIEININKQLKIKTYNP